MSKEKSLKVSLIDGIFSSLTNGFTGDYITPFALILGAANTHIGFLSAAPFIITALAQLKSASIVKWRGSRLKTIVFSMLLQTAIYVGIPLYVIIYGTFPINLFLFLIILYSAMGAVYTPAWSSLMSDTVDSKRYGRYFARRSKITGFVGLAGGFAPGLILTMSGNKLLGFAALFAAAGVFRAVSTFFTAKMDDINVDIHTEKNHFINFLFKNSDKNFLGFVFYVSLMNFSVFLAAPFFLVYLLKVLQAKYMYYALFTTVGTVSGLILLPHWGNLADKYGNCKTVRTASMLLPLTPLVWLITANPLLLLLFKAFSGYAGAAFNMSVTNYIFDSTSSEKRTAHIAFFNVINGAFIFAGSTTGSLLSARLPSISGSPLLTLFFISSLMRLTVFIAGHNKFKEVRNVEEIAHKKFIFNVIWFPRIFFPKKDKKAA